MEFGRDSLEGDKTSGGDQSIQDLQVPLGKPGNFSYILEVKDFLKAHPGIKLYVEDRNKRGKNEEPGPIGELRVGTNDTLQVQFGNEFLAVESYPGRFGLIKDSAGLIAEAIRKIALATAEPIDEDVGFVEQDEREAVADKETSPGQQLENALRDILLAASSDQINVLGDGNCIRVWTKVDLMGEFYRLVKKLGIQLYGCRMSKFNIIQGNFVGKVISQVLANLKMQNLVDILVENDLPEARYPGPHAIALSRTFDQLFILNTKASIDWS